MEQTMIFIIRDTDFLPRRNPGGKPIFAQIKAHRAHTFIYDNFLSKIMGGIREHPLLLPCLDFV